MLQKTNAYTLEHLGHIGCICLQQTAVLYLHFAEPECDALRVLAGMTMSSNSVSRSDSRLHELVWEFVFLRGSPVARPHRKMTAAGTCQSLTAISDESVDDLHVPAAVIFQCGLANCVANCCEPNTSKVQGVLDL